nr:DNA-binding protein [uncultured Carboxylicivirga sp.]
MSTATITFNQLRRIKDSLPDGSIKTIAEELHLDVETVRNYFGGANYDRGRSVGIHIEQGPDGGIVELDDTTILEMARDIISHQDKMAES